MISDIRRQLAPEHAPRDEGVFVSRWTVPVQVGDVCCSLSCRDTEVFSMWQELYGEFLCDKPADFTIDLEITDLVNPACIDAALAETGIALDGSRFRASNGLFAGDYDSRGPSLSMTLERCLLNPQMDFKLMNRVMSMAYNTVCAARHGTRFPALLVHGCGIARHGRGLLFVGPCDAGKTTIARLCGGRYGQVLNDETVLVSRPDGNGGSLAVRGVPIIGGFPQSRNLAVPLSCVLLLKKSKRTAVRPVGRMEAYQRFLLQVISPAHFGLNDRQALLSLIAEFSDEVGRTTPFYELEFTLDREPLWEAVGKLEEWLEKVGET